MVHPLVTIESCLGEMRLSLLVMALISRNRRLQIAVTTGARSIAHWVFAIWLLKKTKVAVLFCDCIELNFLFGCSSASYSSVLNLGNIPKIAMVLQSEF